MAKISVYNPKTTPVIYGNGYTIGGLEWATVEENLVEEYIQANRLIVPRPSVNETPAPATEEVLIDNSLEQETDVSSDTQSQDEVTENSTKDAPSDATDESNKPATIRKSRRRKPTTTEME